MIRIKNLIARIFTKKNIKVFLFVFIILGFFVGNSFAADSSNLSQDTLEMFSWLLNFFISILSRLWFIFAALAGKLMTNDLVYGSFINMDKMLWLLWNIMKNFANFALGFFFVFSIVKTLFSSIGLGKSKGGDDPMTSAKNTVKTTLLAGLLIQMSWFLVGAAIDLSTVATAAVSSLPSQFISSSDSFKGKLQQVLTNDKNGIANGKQLVINLDDASVVTNLMSEGDNIDVNKLLDTIVPSADTVVGPLMFLGVSIFDITTLSVSSHNEGSIGDWKNLFLELGISGFVIFTFTIMLALMTLFNLFRVITLWIIIPMSPLIILLRFLLKDKSKTFLSDSDLSGVTDIKNIFTLIFKPVYMVLVLSIVLIILSMIKGNVINKSNFSYKNIYIEQTKVEDRYNSNMDLAGIVNVNMTGVKNTFVDLLVYIFGLILMFFLMKSCFSKKMTGIKFIDDKIGKLSESIWGEQGKIGGLLGTMGVIPVGPNGNKIGIGTMYNGFKNMDESALTRRVLGNDAVEEQKTAINAWLGINNDYFEGLANRAKNKENFIQEAHRIGQVNFATYADFISDESLAEEIKLWNGKTNLKEDEKVYPIDLKYYWEHQQFRKPTKGSTPTPSNTPESSQDNPQSE